LVITSGERRFNHMEIAKSLLRRPAGQHAGQIPDLLIALGEEKAGQEIGLCGGHTCGDSILIKARIMGGSKSRILGRDCDLSTFA